MKRALVTGGAGFIGRHLTLRLVKDGLRVHVLDDLSNGRRENVPAEAEFVEGSVTDPKLVQDMIDSADEVYHLAAISSVEKCSQDYVYSHSVNASALVGILDAIRKCGNEKRLVYASSAAVYGDQESIPVLEQQLKRPESAYGADKYACELHAQAACSSFGISSTGLRFFNVYGKGQDASSPYSGVISRFVDRIAAGQGVELYGDGLQTRDFVHVSDIVTAIRLVANAKGTEASVFNVCTGVETSIRDLINIVGEIYDRTVDVIPAPTRAGDIRRSAGNPDALETRIGFRPQVRLRDGLIRDFGPSTLNR